MSAETQAERTRAVIAQTLAAHHQCIEHYDEAPDWRCVVTGTAVSVTTTNKTYAAMMRAHLADQVARALAEQAQTTDTLTDDERTALGRLMMRDHGCIHHHGRNAEWSPCRACNRRLDLVTQFLSARSAGDRDAHQALARVRAELYSEDAQAVLHGVTGTHPGSYDGVTKNEALECAGEVLTRLRRTLGDADDQHDGSGA